MTTTTRLAAVVAIALTVATAACGISSSNRTADAVEDTGHLIQLQQPDRAIAAITALLPGGASSAHHVPAHRSQIRTQGVRP